MPHSPQDLHKKVLGKKGETLAKKFLKKQGLKILEENFRTPFGEADVIAQSGDEIIFIEVKLYMFQIFKIKLLYTKISFLFNSQK